MQAGIDEAADRQARTEYGVEKIVDQVNGDLASYETIKKFHLHPGHLSVEAGHITPSLKLRRSQVWKDFWEEFEALYQG